VDRKPTAENYRIVTRQNAAPSQSKVINRVFIKDIKGEKTAERQDRNRNLAYQNQILLPGRRLGDILERVDPAGYSADSRGGSREVTEIIQETRLGNETKPMYRNRRDSGGRAGRKRHREGHEELAK